MLQVYETRLSETAPQADSNAATLNRSAVQARARRRNQRSCLLQLALHFFDKVEIFFDHLEIFVGEFLQARIAAVLRFQQDPSSAVAGLDFRDNGKNKESVRVCVPGGPTSMANILPGPAAGRAYMRQQTLLRLR